METVSEKISIILTVIIAIIIGAGAIYWMEFHETIYYTQVDNSKLERISSSDNMGYEYTLDCYNQNGKRREIKFKTSRELKEDSYLKLEVMVTRGVKSWEEVQVNELPEKVKNALNIE